MSDTYFSVLFVDDEPRILDALRRQLRDHRQRWEMRFAVSGEEGLKLLAQSPADIVVSDMRMPGMTGGQFLSQVRDTLPQAVRIILSGQTDHADLIQALGPIHQYIQKPCPPEQLCNAIERSEMLVRRLRQPTLLKAAGCISSLPPCSNTYRLLKRELANKEADIAKIGKLISEDPAMTAKIMQLANSSFFGTPRKSETLKDAVVRLGLSTINAIVIGGRIFESMEKAGHGEPHLGRLWEASIAIGEAAAKVARENGAATIIQHEARLAGVLSLIGRAVLLTSDPTLYATMIEETSRSDLSLAQVENKHFGASQDDVGAYMLGLWAFDDTLVDAVAFQSSPRQLNPNYTDHPGTYLHLARAARRGAGAIEPLESCPTLDLAFVTDGGIGLHIDPARIAERKVAI